MSPLVSICIPTYNGALYLKDALESVRQQTYNYIEVIVSYDASEDSSIRLVEQFNEEVDFPVYILNHNPNGIGANWNNCIKNANGKYIKFLFQDDVLLPSCIEEMVNVLEKNDSISLVASKRQFIIDGTYKSPEIDQWVEQFGDLQNNLDLIIEDELSIIDNSLFKSKQFLKSPLNKIGEPSVFMFRKQLINTVGYFREDLKQILDYEFCYRLLKTYNIAIINKVLVQFRLHEMQATNINRINNINGSNDDEGFSKILYEDYLNYVDNYTRIHLLKKHSILYKIYYKIMRMFKVD